MEVVGSMKVESLSATRTIYDQDRLFLPAGMRVAFSIVWILSRRPFDIRATMTGLDGSSHSRSAALVYDSVCRVPPLQGTLVDQRNERLWLWLWRVGTGNFSSLRKKSMNE
ncbi:hypothetical protein HYALB_00008982 [Hymenoscyphus albidus]|uniref:Uncharacterized protein n=1 Tax=Hymenoscyphus albidus TaxID=595503 RepID=A0A9N9LSI1_9HELO|nr:hypothetical protein HYALB_00008982 [Hymenoscyphus albidus]